MKDRNISLLFRRAVRTEDKNVGIMSMDVFNSWGFPGGSVGKEFACSAGDPGLIARGRRSPGEGIGNPLQFSWTEELGRLQSAHWVAKSQT